MVDHTTRNQRIAVVGWLYDANDIIMTPLEQVNGVSVVVLLLQVPMSGNVSDHSNQRNYLLCTCKKLVVIGCLSINPIKLSIYSLADYSFESFPFFPRPFIRRFHLHITYENCYRGVHRHIPIL